MEALDKIKDYKMDSSVEDHMFYTLSEYKEYIYSLMKLSVKKREIFLKALNDLELRNNQEMEHEDPFMIELEIGSHGTNPKSSIDVMTNMVLENQPLNTRKIEQIHRLIIRGTNDDRETNYYIRDFDTYVYEVNNGIEKISYIPPSPEEIRPYLKKLYSFLNETGANGELDIFYKPILEHFYVAALQPFGNGNTRLARLMEYMGIFKLSRENLGLKVERPALYMSKNHLLTRKTYRDYIADVACEPTDENLNKWINYNLNMIDEQLNYCGNILYKKYGK